MILPMTVLRRLDSVLEPTNAKVLETRASLTGGKVDNIEPILKLPNSMRRWSAD